MERLALEITVVIVVYALGYKMGHRDCFDYIKQKLDEERGKK